MKQIHGRRRIRSDEELRAVLDELYFVRAMTQVEIGIELRVDNSTVSRWMKHLKMEPRCARWRDRTS